jgi:hypothetical protein
MKLHAIVPVLTLCIAGCGGEAELPNLGAEKAIETRRTFDLAEISTEIEFIPLDDSDNNALVGEIYMMEGSRNGFYILDLTGFPSNFVKFFDRSGRFVSVKGSIGRGPEEYAGASYMTVDHERDNLYLSAGSGGIVAYDAQGKFMTRNDSIRGSQAIFFDDRLIHFNYPDSAPDAGGKFTLVDIYSPTLRLEGHIDVPSKGNVAFPVGFQAMTSNGKNLSIKEELSDTVFYLTPARRLEPAFTMGMGRYAFPREMFNFALSDRWNEFYRVVYIYEGERRTVAMLQNGLMGDICYLVLDPSDPSGGFMPTGGSDGKPGLFAGGISFKPMYIRDNRLVGCMQALDIVDNAGRITDPGLAALAATLKEDSNPVVVIAELN